MPEDGAALPTKKSVSQPLARATGLARALMELPRRIGRPLAVAPPQAMPWAFHQGLRLFAQGLRS